MDRSIQREINKILNGAELPKGEKCTVPEGYFNEMKDNILEQLQISKVEHVPPGYFDSLSERIVSNIQQEESTPIKSANIVFLRGVARWWSVAAVFVGVVCAVGILNQNNGSTIDKVAAEDVDGFSVDYLEVESDFALLDVLEMVDEDFWDTETFETIAAEEFFLEEMDLEDLEELL